MIARAAGCCGLIAFAVACLSAGWLAGKLAERHEQAARAEPKVREAEDFALWERDFYSQGSAP